MRSGFLWVAVMAVSVGGAQPAFEVASVKLSGPQSVRGSDGGPGSKNPGRYTFHSATMQDLLAVAYNVEYFQLSSKIPLDRDRYDLTAKLAPDTTNEQFRAMMQNLLAERFHLKLHIASKDFAAFELVVAKTGLKIKESTDTPLPARDGFPVIAPGKPGMSSNQSGVGGVILYRVRAQQMPMSMLTRMLRSQDDPPVVDKTGLTGKYDFTLEYAKEVRTPTPGMEAEPTSAPSLSTALQQQLGLQLINRKVAFDVLIIDSFDKTPTDN